MLPDHLARGALVANGTPAELKARDPSGRLDEVFRKLTMTEEEISRHVRS